MENSPPEPEEKMGQTPTSSDPFARRAAQGTSGLGLSQDRFKAKVDRGAAKRPAFDKPKAERPKGDAFAAAAAPARGDVFAKTAKPVAEKPAPKPAPKKIEPKLAQSKSPEPKRAPLMVVASQPVMAAREPEPVEVHYQDLKREEARRTRMGKSSSLVLVSGAATAATAPDVIDAPPPAEKSVPPAEPAPLVMPPTTKAEPAPKPKRGGGGGGGAGSGSGGGGAPPRERTFNQDDFVGIAFGAAVLTLLLLWLMRGGGQSPQDNRLVGPQFASNEAVVAPPPAPLVDPFGDVAVDLKPTGPIPEPAPEDPNVGVLEAVPAPAAPAVVVPVADRTMHAWFCTAGSGLTKSSRAALEHEMKQFKDAFAGKELVVRGYADTRGTTAFNSALGGERATVVADFLRTSGLTVVDSSGVGELDGLTDGQNCANQRRVDVYVKGGPGETPSRACAPEPDVEELMCG